MVAGCCCGSCFWGWFGGRMLLWQLLLGLVWWPDAYGAGPDWWSRGYAVFGAVLDRRPYNGAALERRPYKK